MYLCKTKKVVNRSASKTIVNRFETSDGTSRQEQAELRNAGTDQEAIVVRGSYSYVGPDGTQYVINYVADENGFQPVGAHIPKK